MGSFKSSGRSPGRAIALPPALALASASASSLASTFTLKCFKILYFPDHLIDLVHIWYDDRYSSKFYQQYLSPLPQGQGHGLRNILCLRFLRAHIFQT